MPYQTEDRASAAVTAKLTESRALLKDRKYELDRMRDTLRSFGFEEVREGSEATKGWTYGYQIFRCAQDPHVSVKLMSYTDDTKRGKWVFHGHDGEVEGKTHRELKPLLHRHVSDMQS